MRENDIVLVYDIRKLMTINPKMTVENIFGFYSIQECDGKYGYNHNDTFHELQEVEADKFRVLVMGEPRSELRARLIGNRLNKAGDTRSGWD